jgi:hypothetical protein
LILVEDVPEGKIFCSRKQRTRLFTKLNTCVVNSAKNYSIGGVANLISVGLKLCPTMKFYNLERTPESSSELRKSFLKLLGRDGGENVAPPAGVSRINWP